MSYAQVRENVRLLIEGDEIGNTFDTGTLDLLISMGENRVYRSLRADAMRTSATITPASNLAALPANLIQLERVYVNGKQVEVVDDWRLEELLQQGASASDVAYCAHIGSNLKFWPEATTDVTVWYYQKPTAMLTAGESTTYLRYPEVFLFAAVAESAPFVGEDARIPIWESKYQQNLADANRVERYRVFGGSQLRTRSR
jgi:hypothetical protein